jgi:hypothetical protein
VGGRWSGNRLAVSDSREPARRLSLGFLFLVIVRDFDVASMTLLPLKANAVLIVDPNAELSPSITA